MLKSHAGFHLIHYNMPVTAQAMQPFWGATGSAWSAWGRSQMGRISAVPWAGWTGQLRYGEDRHPRGADCLGTEEIPVGRRCRPAIGLDDAARRGGRLVDRSERPANRPAAPRRPGQIGYSGRACPGTTPRPRAVSAGDIRVYADSEADAAGGSYNATIECVHICVVPRKRLERGWKRDLEKRP